MFRGSYCNIFLALRSVAVDVRVRLGQAVRAARQRLGWSQEQLAHAAGLDRTYVSGLERGRRNPALTTQQKIADALGVPLPDLLSAGQKGSASGPEATS